MYSKDFGFGGALLAMWQSKHVGRRAWDKSERVAILPHGLPNRPEVGALIVASGPPDNPFSEYREWHISNADVLASDWYVHE